MSPDPPNWRPPKRIDLPWEPECDACGAAVANWDRHAKWHRDRAIALTLRNAATMLNVPERQRTNEMREEIAWSMAYAKSNPAPGGDTA